MEKVKPGDPIRIKAETWNKMVDAFSGPSASDYTPKTGAPATPSMVMVINDTDTLIPVYGIVEITGLAVQPVDDKFATKTPVYHGIAPDIANRGRAQYAIATDGIAPHTTGRCIIMGITPVMTTDGVISATTTYIEPLFGGSFWGKAVKHITPMQIVGKPVNSPYNKATYTVSITPQAIYYPIPVIVSTVYAAGVYRVDMYPQGYDMPSSGYAFMTLPEGTYGETIPTGAKLMGWQHPARCVGGIYEYGV